MCCECAKGHPDAPAYDIDEMHNNFDGYMVSVHAQVSVYVSVCVSACVCVMYDFHIAG